MPEGPSKPFCMWVPKGIYNAWTKFMWSELLPLSTDTVGESSKTPAKSVREGTVAYPNPLPKMLKLFDQEHSSECEVVAGPSLLDTIDLTNNSEGDDEWSRGKSKAQPTDIIDLT
ncbi:hypothetical protein F4604DRAFT_1918557 [Suillus subluteus]|nr:hypothetical protein F4604DRAFT_1918557 [Suillus subluteus]